MKRIKVIACEVLYRELCLASAHSRNIVDIEFLSQGLHDIGAEEMRDRLQARIDAVPVRQAAELEERKSGDYSRRLEAGYDAVALGYALCSNGIVGLRASNLPLIVPRAHDCITLLLGSKERYQEVFDEHPGTFFLSTGWMERDAVNLETMQHTEMSSLGLDKTYQEYVEQFGEENAKYLMETIAGGLHHYDRFTFIRIGAGPEDHWEREGRRRAEEKGWEFRAVEGDLRILRRLCDAEWDCRDFLTLRPGERIEPSYGCDVIRACPCARC